MKYSLALGTFDGVHKGHKAVLNLPKDSIKAAMIFDHSPKSYITGISESIMTFDDKCKVLYKNGINKIIRLDFEKIRNMTPIEFLNMIKKNYNPSLISCGFNYTFGKNAEGNVDILKEFCNSNNIELKCCSPVKYNGVIVSSSLIRKYLKMGDIEKANELLENEFSFTEKVIHGAQRGRTIGFPTINQKYPDELVVIKFGVYKTKIITDYKTYYGITNIGIRPTFKSDYVISETFIKDFSGNLYNKNVTIIPEKFLRGEVKFSSIEELKNQINKDITF